MTPDKLKEVSEFADAVGELAIEKDTPVAIVMMAGMEIIARSFEATGATSNIKIGSLAVLAHRLLKGEYVDPRAHADETCSICAKIDTLDR